MENRLTTSTCTVLDTAVLDLQPACTVRRGNAHPTDCRGLSGHRPGQNTCNAHQPASDARCV